MKKFLFPIMILALVVAKSQAHYVAPTFEYSEPDSLATDFKEETDTISRLSIIEPIKLTERIDFNRQSALKKLAESELTDSIESQATGERVKINGFRVLAFSDNNQKTSQREAQNLEKSINEQFPELETYIVYNSPYWRLKVGDFRSEFDAETAADEIKRAFPKYAREVRIVRDRITVIK